MRPNETKFDFLNRSAKEEVEAARKMLESWYSKFPEAKKKALRGNFRKDDQPHRGALLEMAVHEGLQHIGSSVQVEPAFLEGNPDFQVTYRGVKIVVECKVAEEREMRMINDLEEKIGSLDTVPFALYADILRVGTNLPSTSLIHSTLGKWLASLDVNEEARHFKRSQMTLRSSVLDQDGWQILFRAMPVESGNVVDLDYPDDGQWNPGPNKLRKVVGGKAAKYQKLGMPYIIVVGSALHTASIEDMQLALYGQDSTRGLFGSRSKPRKRHVSAVLLKPNLSLWTLCGIEGQWKLFTNPWAKYPIPHGLIPLLEPIRIGPIPHLNTKDCPYCQFASAASN